MPGVGELTDTAAEKKYTAMKVADDNAFTVPRELDRERVALVVTSPAAFRDLSQRFDKSHCRF
jgi:hypothetical protein